MFEISVCMIIKNEEVVLERCLKCVSQFADEIIIVDTGSTDKSCQIAKKFTSKVYSYSWNNNFSKARNFSFSLATKDYIMWCDADDVISSQNIDKIKKLKNIKTDTDVFMLKYEIDFDTQENPIFTYYRERIVKRKNNYLWQGVVHEAITAFGKIEYCDIAISHRKVKKTPQGRNLKIYNKYLKNNGKLEARDCYYYARELYFNQFYRKAIIYFQKFQKFDNKFLPNIVDSYFFLAKCYLQFGEIDKAQKVLLKLIQTEFPNNEICCLLGDIAMQQNNIYKAIFWYHSAINCPEFSEAGFFVQSYFSQLYPNLQLVVAYYKINDFVNSKKHHLIAKNISPQNSIVLNNEKYFT